MSAFSSKWASWNANPPGYGSAKGAKSPISPPSGTNGTSVSGGVEDFGTSKGVSRSAGEAQVMRQAIEEIAGMYSPELDKILEAKFPSHRNQVQAIPLDSLDNVEKWRAGWLRLLDMAKRHSHVSA